MSTERPAGGGRAPFAANTAWALLFSYDLVLRTTPLLAAIALGLAVVYARLQRLTGDGAGASLADRVLLGALPALFLGWAIVATAANVGSTGVFLGLDAGETWVAPLGAAALLGAAAIVAWVILGSRRAAGGLALGVTWALVAIVATPPPGVLATGAGLAAVVVVASLAARARRVRPPGQLLVG